MTQEIARLRYDGRIVTSERGGHRALANATRVTPETVATDGGDR